MGYRYNIFVIDCTFTNVEKTITIITTQSLQQNKTLYYIHLSYRQPKERFTVLNKRTNTQRKHKYTTRRRKDKT